MASAFMQNILDHGQRVQARVIRRWTRAILLPPLLSLLCAGCSPTLDWRDTAFPDAGGLSALFPCRPDRFERQIVLAGRSIAWSMASCKAGGSTYAMSSADMVDPRLVSAALSELHAVIARNVGGPARTVKDVQLVRATPNALSQQIAIQGRAADGGPLQAQALFFVRGTRIFQATILGPALAPEGIDTFFASLRLGA